MQFIRFLLILLFSAQFVISGRNFYSILNVERSANKNQIKKAYRELAKKLHPDKNKNDPDADNKFKEINEAYEVLSDQEKRRVYDKFGEEGLKDMDRGGGSPMDSFSSFFGDFFGGQEQRPEDLRGDDIFMDLEVTLEELYNGNFIEMVRMKPIKKSAPGTRKCNCRYEMHTTQLSPGRFTMNQVEVCDNCDNFKYVSEERLLEVEVEKGMPHGHKYTFRGEGEPHADGDPGDLTFIFKQAPHPVFHRKGDDLYTNLTISLADSLIGFDYELAHLDGHKVKISRSKITWTGAVLSIRGEGMPNYNDNSKKGTLYITFDVAMPRNAELTAEQKEQVREMLSVKTVPNKPVPIKTEDSTTLAKTIADGNGPAIAFNGFEKSGPRKHLSKYL